MEDFVDRKAERRKRIQRMADIHDQRRLPFQLLAVLLTIQRKKLDRLQEELGVALGYSPTSAKQAVSAFESGRVSIPAKKLPLIAKELKLDAAIFKQVESNLEFGNFAKATELLKKMFQTEFDIDIDQELTEPTGSGSSEVTPPVLSVDISAKLAELKHWNETGLIDAEEYKTAKQALLEKYTSL